jgi:WD40 repeat protein
MVTAVAFDPTGRTLASASSDNTVKLWDPNSGQLIRSLEGHSVVLSVAFDPAGSTLASASADQMVQVWDAGSPLCQLLRSLEGHTGIVSAVAFSSDGHLIASKGTDHTVRLWRSDVGACVATIPEPASDSWLPGLAFHPLRRTLATAGSAEAGCLHIWELDFDVLLVQTGTPPVSYTSAKIVLVGTRG